MKYITPCITILPLKTYPLCGSSKHGHHGWGPDKDSDSDGHDMPPGQNKGFYQAIYSDSQAL